MLALTLGLKKEAFELRLLTLHKYTIDIFLVYKMNDTYQWNGYQSLRKLFRYDCFVNLVRSCKLYNFFSFKAKK